MNSDAYNQHERARAVVVTISVLAARLTKNS
jgi:hypothetical protein